MTPEERQRVTGLFDRLAQLESAPRDHEAEDVIMEGLRRAPNSAYAMVQTILVQEEALERANERIRELETRVESDEQPSTGGFLDAVRGALTGQAAAPARGSVPNVRSGSEPTGMPMGVPLGFRSAAGPAGNQPQEIGRGGSFLGQAASIAAGVVAGSLVVDALRGQFGSQASESAKTTESGPWQANTEQDRTAEQQPAEYQEADYESADFGDDFDIGSDFG